MALAIGDEAVTAFGLHHRGRVRDDDQDYVLFWGAPGVHTGPPDAEEHLDPRPGSRLLSATRLFILADGMGGLEEGARAARTACHGVFDAFRAYAKQFNRQAMAYLGDQATRDGLADWADPLVPHLTPELVAEARRVLARSFEAANQPLWRKGGGRSGAALVAATICDHQLLITAAGDCRAYLIPQAGRPQLLTQDDNLAWDATASGRLTYAEAVGEGLASRLTKYLGMAPDLQPADYALGLAAGGRIVLCSDGLYGSFDDERSLARLARGGGPQEAGQRLLEGALNRGGHDNIAVLVVDIPAVQGPPPGVLVTPTPVHRRKPAFAARLRQWRRRAAAERWGTKAALASVLLAGLGGALLLAVGNPFLGTSGSSSATEDRQNVPRATATQETASSNVGQAVFGGGGTADLGDAGQCRAAELQVCPRRGETLDSLAQRLGLNPDQLAEVNQNIPRTSPLRGDVPVLLPRSVLFPAAPVRALTPTLPTSTAIP